MLPNAAADQQASSAAPKPAKQQSALAALQSSLNEAKPASSSSKKASAPAIKTQTFTQALELPEDSMAAETSPLNLMFVSAEVAPWSKTGGLGDVVGGLPIELAKRGHRVLTVAPRYDQYEDVRSSFWKWMQGHHSTLCITLMNISTCAAGLGHQCDSEHRWGGRKVLPHQGEEGGPRVGGPLMVPGQGMLPS